MTSGEFHRLNLSVLPGRLAVCQMEPDAVLPAAGTSHPLYAMVRTGKELSIVCPEENVPEGARVEDGWRGLEILGPFEFSAIGVLLSVAAPLAEAQISLFVLSTFDTDYVLIKEDSLEPAIEALIAAGHSIEITF